MRFIIFYILLEEAAAATKNITLTSQQLFKIDGEARRLLPPLYLSLCTPKRSSACPILTAAQRTVLKMGVAVKGHNTYVLLCVQHEHQS